VIDGRSHILNSRYLQSRSGLLHFVLMLVGVVISAPGEEYELSGRITQTIVNPNTSVVKITNDFTVYVRGCGWLIQTVENDVVDRRLSIGWQHGLSDRLKKATACLI